jgi:hypothetical protein
MGPMFSMFTKWPTSVGSNIIDIWQENPTAYKKLKRYFEVYGGQLALLSALGYAVKKYEGDSGVINYLIGDPKEISPALALDPSMGNNPTWEAFTTGLEQAKKEMRRSTDVGDTAKSLAKKATKKIVTTAIPPVSSVLNELERIQKKGMGEEKSTLDEALGDIFD